MSALASGCKPGPPPEDLRPEITVETILEDINGQRIDVGRAKRRERARRQRDHHHHADRRDQIG